MSQESIDQLIALAAIVGVMVCLFGVLYLILNERKRRRSVEPTPVTEEGLKQYDDFAPGEAVYLAWSEPGNTPRWHGLMQEEVRKNMPVLARALDRLVEN